MEVSSTGHWTPFHITIATSPAYKTSVSLEDDLRMVKAALLYADRATLCSPLSFLVLSVQALGDMNPRQQLDFLEEWAEKLYGSSADGQKFLKGLERYRRLKRKSNRNKAELLQVLQFEASLRDAWEDVGEIAAKLATEAGADEIARAVESGLLELHIFQSSDEIASTVDEYVDVVKDAVSDGSTYPLFDDQTGILVSQGIREGEITVPEWAIARGKQIRLASQLLENLPLFDFATIDEILDIRHELDRALVRFRSAMIRFSDDIKTAPWDKGFSAETEYIYRREIAPAILEIEENIKSNKSLSDIAYRIATRSPVAPASVFGFLISSLSSFPEIASMGLNIAGGIGVAESIIGTCRERRQKKQEIERNQLFFYYRAGKLLGDLVHND